MASVTGLTLVKRFEYRDDPNEEFSNTYHFKTSPPGDDASWNVLVNDAIAKEQQILFPTVSYTRAYGYDSDDPNAHHVFAIQWDQSSNPPRGTLTPGADPIGPGDLAACVVWKTSRLNSRGKPIYLRKYFHHIALLASDMDKVSGIQASPMNDFAGPLGMNSVYGGLRSRSHDENLQLPGHVIEWVTTRTLKRRGKRPRTGS